MAPVVLPPISDEKSLEKHLERQMGCMAGFLQIFDRSQLISPKRIYASRRLHSFPATGSAAGSTSPSERSDLSAAEFLPSSPEKTPARSPLPLPVFDSWKLREAPRLSLDSRLRHAEARLPVPAAANGSGGAEAEAKKIRRPPSVVARLMGLDALPEPVKQAELRRSASESRVPRETYRFGDEEFVFKKYPAVDLAPDLAMEFRSKPLPPPPKTTPAARKSFFDAHDFFPDPNRTGSGSLYNEIERRLRMRGIDEPAKDLETLKQILEASQLRGLLRSGPSDREIDLRRRRPPIVVLKPDPKPLRRSGADQRRNRTPRSPASNPRKPRIPEPQRRFPSPSKKASTAVHSQRNRRSAVDVSTKEETFRSPSPAILDRCDELLRNIAAFTLADQQPSPVSVLDLPFLAEESSPLPVTTELTDWEDNWWAQALPPIGLDVTESDGADFAYVYDILRSSDRIESLDGVYNLLEKRHGAADESETSVLHRRLIFDMVAAIVARKCHVSAWEAFSSPSVRSEADKLIREVWLEVQQMRDNVTTVADDDLDGVTCVAIRKDMGGIGVDNGWRNTSAEMSDAVVLHIERMVFKDLVAETIRDLADEVGGKCLIRFRRKLVF